MKNKKYIVYKITNKITGRVYIGQTTESIEKRWQRHKGYQSNDGTYFHNAIKKYGPENFIVEIIDEAKDQQELNDLEFFYINKYKDNCYNTKFENKKCGGDTLSYNKNLNKIKLKLSNGKKYEKNPNAKKIIMINIIDNTNEYFNSMKECQDKYNIPRHDIIFRRCSHKIKKPYLDIYMFEYAI